MSTIAATLPVCSVRGVAYSTFTIILHLIDNESAEIIQYDNPMVDSASATRSITIIPKPEMTIGGKKIYKSRH